MNTKLYFYIKYQETNGPFSILIDFKKKGTKTSDTTRRDNKQSFNRDILNVLRKAVSFSVVISEVLCFYTCNVVMNS